MSGPVRVFTVDELAALLACSTKTVEEWARAGRLPGIKPGGSWVFPAGALALRLDELAIDEAMERRKGRPATAVLHSPALPGKRGRKPRELPRLIDLRALAPGAKP